MGISRSDEGVLDRALVQAVLAAGAGRDVLSYRTLKVLADLDPAVAEVIGFTRYRHRRRRSITVVDRGGLASQLTSRVERRPALSGTKRRVASRARGARGPRPQRRAHRDHGAGGEGRQATGITLLHVRFHDRLDAAAMRGVLQGYDRRYDRLVDWVTETEGAFATTASPSSPSSTC